MRGMESGKHTWGDEFGEDDYGQEGGREQLQRDWDARREEFWNSGYREGLEAGKHETVQAGFNAGYAKGAEAGYAWGAACGAVASLAAFTGRVEGQLGTEDLQKAVRVPLKHAAQAVISDIMAEHASAAPPSQSPAISGSCAEAASAAALPLPYDHDVLQARQQRVVCLLKQQGMHLSIERHADT